MDKKLFDIPVKTGVIAGSSPLSLDGESMIALYKSGADAVVTKNLSLPVQRNPYHYMRISKGDTLINCERALDYGMDRWIDTEIPIAVKAGVPVIANVGTQRHMVKDIIPRIEAAGVCAFECVSYVEDWLVDVVDEVRKQTDLPVIAKISPNYKDVVKAARRCVEAGCDGFTVGDSIGPIFRIDIETGKPYSGGMDGLGWMSGPGLFPFALRNVVEIRKNFDLPIIGMGGVTTSEDALEMFMGGANAVGLCSSLVTHGMEVIGEIDEGIRSYLDSHGHKCICDVCGITHKYLVDRDDTSVFDIRIREEECTLCGDCIRSCVYNALEIVDGRLSFNRAKCSGCGMCLGRCKAVDEIID